MTRTAKVTGSAAIDLNTNILAIDDFAGPIVIYVVIRFKANPVIVDPEQLPGRT